MFKLIKDTNFSSLQLNTYYRGLNINRILSKFYSTKQDKYYSEDDNFLKRFVGFSDAESSFTINTL